MNFIKAIFTLIVLCVALSLSALSNASTEHGHTETETKGPNGGILLSDGDLSVEITIYETGIPPEMRVYTYLNGEIAAPKAPG